MGDGSIAQPHSQQTSSPPTHSNLFPVGSIVEVRSDNGEFRDTYFSGTVVSQVSYSMKVEVKYHNRFKDEDESTPLTEEIDIQCLRPSPAPQEIVEGFEPGDIVEAFYKEDWWIGVVSGVVDGEEMRYVVKFQNMPNGLEFSFSDLRVHWDWVNGNWIRPHNKGATKFMFNAGSEVEVSPSHKSTWYSATIEYMGNRPYFLVRYGGVNTGEPTKIEMANSFHVRPPPPLFKNNNFVPKENVDAFFYHGWWSGIIKQKLSNNRYIVSFELLNMEREFDHLHLRSQMEWKNDKWIASYQVAAPHFREADIPEFPADSCAVKTKQSEIVESSKKRKRGRPGLSPVEPSQNVTEASPVSGVEQPIETNQNVKALAIDIETSSSHMQVKTLNHQESEVPTPMMDKHPLALKGQQGLPFVKRSILWKTLEAMDPFQRIPQNPHFQPLQHIIEGLREGEAIGYMVTFSDVVKKVYGLQFGDPKSVTDNILEALAELEKHGFNIKPVKDRVSKLLVVKDKGDILVGDVKKINGRILEHRQKKDRVEDEIEGMKKEIQKMEQKLSVLESAKEKEEGETAAAVHRVKKTEERIADVKRKFECIVSSAF